MSDCRTTDTPMATLHLLRYLAGTRNYGITLTGDCDLSNVIYCYFRRQHYLLAAEYRALFKGTQESVWIKFLLQSLNLKITSKFNIYVDNQSAIALAINPLFQQRTKHIDIIYHWLREVYDSGLIHISYIPTHQMKANVCTKALGRRKHQDVINNLHMPGQ
ncbi:uncharacterized protein VP01_3234g3 [Puccinia sorghi]|uniref:Uncharacterized protein n=1 Tax=Puccinia sorghi TaxID=27349 RepID=A0A0L6UZ06_9BASI|nr:uncharacterized protein VP01_3234g3 [Puccinia sorghi]